MQFDIFSLFPNIIDSYIKESILGRAIDNKIISVNSYNIRDYTLDKHRVTDSSPYGGGAGMVMKIEPIYQAICKNSLFEFEVSPDGLKHSSKQRIIVLSAKGKILTQNKVRELAEYQQIMLICGRYEGIDERVAEYIADEEISIGEYVLTGGEMPALVLLDAIARMQEGVLGNKESLEQESFLEKGKVEYPHYTRPEIFSPKEGIEWKVPSILLSGNHQAIEDWKRDA